MTETLIPPVDLQRAADLAIARCAADAVEAADEFFVLTGSYSIEALTHSDIRHNDVDANVFTRDIPRAMARLGLLLGGEGGMLSTVTCIENTKPNRLEYTIESPVGRRDLELQFIEFTTVRDDIDGRSFILSSCHDREVIIPTVQHSLTDPGGEARHFTVKSLPFAIATWALRISGAAEAQKRPVRQSDIDHFAFLLDSPHTIPDVLLAMKHHPQMPDDAVATAILQSALSHIEN